MTKVNEPSNLVKSMREQYAPVTDIAAGGPHMRKMGKRYLPKFRMETDEDYKERLANTWLFNGIDKAAQDMAGKVFERPTALEDEEGQLFEWAQNIDLEGRDLSNFASDLLTGGLMRGMEFVMVDAPPRPGDVTRGEAQALGLRPYMSRVTLDEVLGWRWENIGNAPTVTQFRMMETIADPARGEFSDDTIEQVRALFLEEGRVVVRLYRRGDAAKDKGEFILFDEYATDMTEIQVVPFYTGRTGFWEAKSPLCNIAELNLAHWRTQSDKANCLHKSLSPLLLIKAMPDLAGGTATTSAGYGFYSDSTDGDIAWREITGSGIAEGRTELKDLEQQMQWMGLQLILERSGVSTATGDAIDEGKETSRLRVWADNLKDTLEIAMGWMADMGGLSGANTSVSVHKDFSALGHMSMTDVKDMFMAGALSRETYLREGKRRGVIGEDVSLEDEAERIEREALPGVTDDAI